MADDKLRHRQGGSSLNQFEQRTNVPERDEKKLRFPGNRPADVRAARPWHRYSYYINAFPARVQKLCRDMDVPAGARILDYGCADLPYRRMFPKDVDFVGADLQGNPNAALDLRPDGTVPADEGSFDVVLSTQVLEHVGDPALYLSECLRVLRPGGRMLLSTHGVFIYHPDPVDYWRWTCAGLERQVRAAGLEVEHLEGFLGLTATGLQLLEDACYYHLPSRLRSIFVLVMQGLIRIAERFSGPEAGRLNASVFFLVARKPGSTGI